MSPIEILRTVTNGALNSQDPSTQNAAGIVSAQQHMLIRCNGMPAGVFKYTSRYEPEFKSMFVEHAERAVIFAAACRGISLENSTMYSPWAPCAECARAIISSGVTKLVTLPLVDQPASEKWKASILWGLVMLKESGVQHEALVPESLTGWPILRRHGHAWQSGAPAVHSE